jgi:CRP/FNR family cyclic AMP-dependent transcriptional regulator
MQRMVKCSPALIENLPVFNKLVRQQCEDIARRAVGRSYEPGEFITHQGEFWPYALILESGIVNVQKFSLEGRVLGAWWLSPGEVFWSPSLFDDGPLPASLEVRQSSAAYLWHRDDMMPHIQSQPEALLDLCKSLVERMRRASSMVEDLAFHPLTVRVARLLIKQYESTPGTHVTRSLTLDDMAKIIGTTPVMVCKIISSFASEGLIKVSRTEFELINKDGLDQIAG